MEEAQSTCQKVELSGNIRVLLRELPLTCEKRKTDDGCQEFLTSVDRVLQISLDASIVVEGMLLLSHLTKRR